MGDEKTKKSRIRELKIDTSGGNAIKHENVDEFPDSLFCDNYYDAFFMTAQVVNRNNLRSDKGDKRSAGNGYGSAGNSIGSNGFSSERSGNQERLHNMITFCGERGMGKTSVMSSFLEALNNLSCEGSGVHEFICDYEKRQGRKESIWNSLNECKFICLDTVSASLLEDKEDILEVILARMYKMFLEQTDAYEPRKMWERENSGHFSKEDFIRKLERVYSLNRRVEDSRSSKQGDSTTEFLGSLSDSLALQDTFREFVSMFLQIADPYSRKERYLVISIDDLDMGMDGYEKLEKLHRYLMVPGVIIYLAVSSEELQSVCLNHFKACRYKNAERLTMTHLEKVLPFSQRIYLPSVLNSGFSVRLMPERMDVKKSILYKMNHVAWVFYDGCGQKTHFYEVNNLRTLVNLVIFLNNMVELPKEFPTDADGWMQYMTVFDGNIEKLRNDVINRMSLEKLTDDISQKVFASFHNEDPARRGIMFLDWVKTVLDDWKFTYEYDQAGYSYGEFLRALYLLGRKKREFKPLVHCLLAIETISMTHTYVHAIWNGEDEEAGSGTTIKEIYRKQLTECISGSVCGTWGNYMIPKYQKDSDKASYGVGYMPERNCDIVLDTALSEEEQARSALEVCNCLIDSYHIVERLEILFGFLYRTDDVNETKFSLKSVTLPVTQTQADGNGNQNPQQGGTGNQNPQQGGNGAQDPSEEGDGKQSAGKDSFELTHKVVNIILPEASYSFDILGFVSKRTELKELEEFFTNLHTNILDAMCEFAKGMEPSCEFNEDDQKNLREKIKQKSMKDAYIAWSEKYKGIALPIYSTDILYNVLKRARNSNRELTPKSVPSGFANQISSFFEALKKGLQEEDVYYGKVKDGYGAAMGFAEPFEECPLVKKFLEVMREEGTVDNQEQPLQEDRQKPEKNTEKLPDLSELLIKDIDNVIFAMIDEQILEVLTESGDHLAGRT